MTHFASRLPQVSPGHRRLKPVQEGALLEFIAKLLGKPSYGNRPVSDGSFRPYRDRDHTVWMAEHRFERDLP
ncbi:hypothetical protein RKD26_000034 [Streptomyces calvus]